MAAYFHRYEKKMFEYAGGYSNALVRLSTLKFIYEMYPKSGNELKAFTVHPYSCVKFSNMTLCQKNCLHLY
jgi:hypothetical protein